MPLHLRAAMRNLLARFAVSNQGNVAIIFAIASIPMIAAMGLAVDYTRAAQTNSAMQDALDAASLALSRRADLSTMTPAQIQKFAQDYFNANFHNSELQDLTLNASYTPTGPSVTISANGNAADGFHGDHRDQGHAARTLLHDGLGRGATEASRWRSTIPDRCRPPAR